MAIESPSTAASHPTGALRLRLRDATAQDHAAVDRAFGGFDLATPSGYRGFLEAQYSVLSPVESALTEADAAQLLPEWPLRLRAGLLAADLAELGVPAKPVAPVDPSLAALLRDPPGRLGALYVLEGSRFGGAVLARQLPAGWPARFLGAPSDARVWRGLVAAMDAQLDTDPAFAGALDAAHAVFAAFEAAARARLDPAGA